MTDLDRLRAIDPALVVECEHYEDGGLVPADHWGAGCPGPVPNLSALIAIAEAGLVANLEWSSLGSGAGNDIAGMQAAAERLAAALHPREEEK